MSYASKRIRAALLLLAFALLSSPSAFAVQRTFVSTVGSDSNTASNCSNTAPCRGFAAALTVTDAGGEIIVKDSGGYGPVTISQSVSLIAPEGAYAGISVFSGAGVTIATAGVNVVLRGLTLNGMGGNNGVSMTNGASLTLQNCTAKNFGPGAAVFVNTAARVRILDSTLQTSYNGLYIAGGVQAEVSGTRILDNSHEGLYVYGTGSGVTTSARVVRSEVNGNGVGYEASGFLAKSESSALVNLFVKDSAANGNSASGVYAWANGGFVDASVSASLMSGNSCGIGAGGTGAYLVAFGNSVVGNGAGLCQSSSATLQSLGDNNVTSNDFQYTGAIGSTTKF